MKRCTYLVAIVFCLIVTNGYGQLSDFPVAINFTRATLFYDFAKLENDTHLSKKGSAIGARFEIGRYYGGDDPSLEEEFFRLGWYFSAQGGAGRMKNPDDPESRGSRWIPLNLDIGFVSRLRFGPNTELGAHYGFLGIYGYSTTALFGSSCSLRFRLKGLQMEYGREGTGVFTGCFVPKFQSYPVHQFSFMWLNKTHISAGFRYTVYNRSTKGGTPNSYLMKEFRFLLGLFI